MTRNAAPTIPAQVRWPSHRFYWAVLDTSLLPSSERPTTDRLRYLLEPELPEPLDEVHAVFAQLNSKSWIACALPKRVLQGDVAPATVTLRPSDVPAFARAAVGAIAAPDRLNLLVDEFEPLRVSRARRACAVLTTASIALVFALALLGIERRTAQARNEAGRLRFAREHRITTVLGPNPAGQRLPPELRLAADLRNYRQTRRHSDQIVTTRDAADTLVDLFRHWPADLPTRTDAIVVSDAAVHVRGSVAESEQAQHLATATQGLDGFEMGFPSVQSGPGGWNFGIEWRRTEVPRR